MPQHAIQQLEKLDDLQPGDILLFLPKKKKTLPNKLISTLQALIYQDDGYYTTTHAAVYIGTQHKNIRDEHGTITQVTNQHMIAHVTEAGFKFAYQPLEEIYEKDKEERPFIAYRANDSAFGETIAKRAMTVKTFLEQHDHTLEWTASSAASSLLMHSDLSSARKIDEKNRQIEGQTHCSKFAAQVIKIAAMENKKYNIDLRSTITPAGLLRGLAKNQNYSCCCYMGKDNIYELLKTEINRHLTRIQTRSDEKSKQKALACSVALNTLTSVLDNSDKNDIEKAKALLKKMLPVLAVQTGFSLYKEASTARELRAWAAEKGIFKDHLSDDEGEGDNDGEHVHLSNS